MAIAHAGTPSTGTASSTSLTFSHTVPAGSNRCLIVDVAARDTVSNTPIPTAVTFNGVAMTNASSDNLAEFGSSLWRLLAPTETTANVVVTMPNASVIGGGARNYTGVHQTTPVGATDAGSGSGSPATRTVASATGELVVDTVYVSIGGAAPVVGAGQTSRTNIFPASDHYLVASEEAGAATVTMSWTLGASNDWVSSVAALLPASGGAFSLPLAGDSYGVTGTDATVFPQQIQTWLRVGR